MTTRELRAFPVALELRREGQKAYIEGMIPYGVLSEDLGGYREKIAPSAFTRTLNAGSDVKLLWAHDEREILASTAAGTMRLESRADGLHFSALAPTSAASRVETIERGDCRNVSFGFIPDQGVVKWEGEVRTVTAARLLEISVGVAFPAYPDAHADAARRAREAAQAERDAVEVALALILNA